MKGLRCGVLLVLLFATLLLAALNWQAKVIQKQQEVIRVLHQDSQELLRQRMLQMRQIRQQRLDHRIQQLNSKPEPGAGVGCLPYQTCG